MDIIMNEELFTLAKSMTRGMFDQNNLILNRIRKPFHDDEIRVILQEIEQMKLWGERFVNDILIKEEELVIVLDFMGLLSFNNA